jgi:type IV pilus assembly protein PilA
MAQAVLDEGLVRRRSAPGQRGFTLVELSAVVIIVSILALVAVVGYRRLITSSHNAEATHMVNAIRTAQEAYRAETGQYADITNGIAYADGSGALQNGGAMYPTTSPGNRKVGWGAACSNCNTGYTWQQLPVHTDGAVMYGYTTTGGPPGGSLTSYTLISVPASITLRGRSSGSYTLTFPAPVTDWYIVSAAGDPDGNGFYSSYTGSSFTNDIFDSNDGE